MRRTARSRSSQSLRTSIAAARSRSTALTLRASPSSSSRVSHGATTKSAQWCAAHRAVNSLRPTRWSTSWDRPISDRPGVLQGTGSAGPGKLRLFRFGGEVLARVDEAVALEAVLLVVQLL